MFSYRLDIAYDGTEFRGWARQPGARTVQGELETALERLAGEPVALTVAGRTDAGVHALAQVASFTTSRPLPERLAVALNALTPPDLAVLAAERAPDGFDARRQALSRGYRYRVHTARVASPFERRRSLHWPHRLERGALEACAEALGGNHDFTAFTPTETTHVRFQRDVLAAGWREEGGEEPVLAFEIEADAFMRSMVRVLVGTMLEVAAGRRSVSGFRELLGGRPRALAGETAPAHGLYLVSVRYR